MATSSDLTTESGLSTYLTSHSVPYTRVQILTGGTANYVYRVVLNDGKTVIYKHAEPYLHSNTSFAFDPTRMDYEDRVLEILPPLLRSQIPESSVHAVGRYSYDRESKLLCIEDGGERELKMAYSDPSLNIEKVGAEIGRWIAALHVCSQEVSLALDGGNARGSKGNNPIGVAIYRHSYRNLASTLPDYGYDEELGKKINDEFGSKLATDDECVCHGDFWPGNVLVKLKDANEEEVDLTVVDWEMTRRGIGATDIGQFAAEAFLLDRFRGSRGLLPAFLNSYASTRGKSAKDGGVVIGKEWVRRMAIHWAVHIAFWPTRVEWADREGTQRLVDIGVGVLRAAIDSDWDQLRNSVLFAGVGEALDHVWE